MRATKNYADHHSTSPRQHAHDIGRLAAEFAGYLRSLGDQTEFNLNAAAYLRDGFARLKLRADAL